MIQRRFDLDTSTATVEETMKEFEEKIEPNLSDSRSLANRSSPGLAFGSTRLRSVSHPDRA